MLLTSRQEMYSTTHATTPKVDQRNLLQHALTLQYSWHSPAGTAHTTPINTENDVGLTGFMQAGFNTLLLPKHHRHYTLRTTVAKVTMP